MKNLSVIKKVLLGATLSVFFFSSCNNSNSQGGGSSVKFIEGDSVGVLPIAYVNLDSLLSHYDLYKDASEVLMEKSKKADATLKSKQRQFENDVQDFQRKLQNNAFLSEDRARQAQAGLQRQENELHALAQKLQEDIAKEQIRVNNQIADSVRLNLEEYNKTANYQMILSNTGMDNILLAKDQYNITDQIIKLMNSRYKSESSK
ncbi:outer membrane protein [Dysgonomonas hofstadii]|uniref:Outer membrane protein n=1 Tax=Dysgonomonas hofstadii TaxID=637886 RepID=A0A840CRT2_9BACT|nr:OmpH family outer membrane protein [Dysgonomonas hofstadii]MBB4037369.1 outer membrane protein [Dysgonomonas hofstadii]